MLIPRGSCGGADVRNCWVLARSARTRQRRQLYIGVAVSFVLWTGAQGGRAKAQRSPAAVGGVVSTPSEAD